MSRHSASLWLLILISNSAYAMDDSKLCRQSGGPNRCVFATPNPDAWVVDKEIPKVFGVTSLDAIDGWLRQFNVIHPCLIGNWGCEYKLLPDFSNNVEIPLGDYRYSSGGWYTTESRLFPVGRWYFSGRWDNIYGQDPVFAFKTW